MSEVSDMLQRYKEIRQRLTFPPNAVPDTGINLKRQEEWQPRPLRQLPTPPPVEYIGPLSSPTLKVKQLTLASTVGITAKAFGMNISQLKTKSRKSRYVLPRQVAIYVATQQYNWSVTRIAHFLDLDHTTALYARKKIAHQIKDDLELRLCVESIERKIDALHTPTNASERQQHLAQGSEREDIPKPTLSALDGSGG